MFNRRHVLSSITGISAAVILGACSASPNPVVGTWVEKEVKTPDLLDIYESGGNLQMTRYISREYSGGPLKSTVQEIPISQEGGQLSFETIGDGKVPILYRPDVDELVLSGSLRYARASDAVAQELRDRAK